jgi:NAD(P)-dependent dehydrogenase (short-subunit alcohol dehydrogenase family)
MSLESKVVVITGGGTGLGADAAKAIDRREPASFSTVGARTNWCTSPQA